MLNNAAISRLWRQHGMLVLALLAVFMLMAMPHVAHAATETGNKELPFEEPLSKLINAIRGPVAFAISLLGIIGAGAALIFGGEMSGFMRTMVFLVLVISIIANATNLIHMVGGEGALISEGQAIHVRWALLSARGIG
jgi:type IV secretion system protein TrbC